MQVKQTGFDGLVEIVPVLFNDSRGWFYEFFNKNTFEKLGLRTDFVQENTSFSKKGVIRGMHFQLAPYAQAKLVTVLSGKALDVVVDLRSASRTFGQAYYCTLTAESRNMLLIPEGFAHGFAALEDTVFYYKCSNFYNKSSESGLVYNDPELNINWPFADPVVSEKDLVLPTLAQLLGNSVISR